MVHACVCQACEVLQAEKGRVERLAQIVCEQRSLLDSCPEATKEPLQEQLARVSTNLTGHYHRSDCYTLQTHIEPTTPLTANILLR